MADRIDAMLEQWRRERPDLDLSALGTFGRLAQLMAVLTPRVERVLTAHGLRGGEFDVLAALRRSGEPYAMMPSELSDVLMMSRAGMTNRLDRLAAAGLVDRALDPGDRRSFRITLTDRGRSVVDAALTEHAANLAGLVAVLSDDERTTLNRTLQTLQDAVGRPTD